MDHYNSFNLKSMSSKQYVRNSLSRDRIGVNNAHPPMQYRQDEKTFLSHQNQAYPTKKQSSKSYISGTKIQQNSLQMQRKGSQTSNHHQYSNARDPMRILPSRNVSYEGDEFFRGKQRSQQPYVEDDNDRQMRSQSSEQDKIFMKRDSHKKRQIMTHSQMQKSSTYLEEDYLDKHASKRDNYTNQAYSYVQKQPKQKDYSTSEGLLYINRKKNSSQSSPPLPNNRKNSHERLRQEDSPIKMEENNLETPEKQKPKMFRLKSDGSSSIKNHLQRFSMSMESNIDAIFDKVEELEKKHLSLDLYFQELRQSISHRKDSETENKQISFAKNRQFKFLIGQYESKIKQVKKQNQRLQKELINIRIKQDQNKSKIIQNQLRFRQYANLEENLQKIKKGKSETQKKLIDAQCKINQLQQSKLNLESQLQRVKKNIELQQSAVKEEHNASQFISNSTLFGSYDDADYLKQQVSKLQYENKQYQKLMTAKSTQISNLSRSNTEAKMMMDKIKEMNEELEEQCAKLQRENVQKQLEATQKICALNSSIKKKLKQYDNFKDLIVQCLDQVYKKTPKKIRKTYDSEVINKNRTNKCEVMFKCINSAFSYYDEQMASMSECLFKDFSISPIEVQKIGLQACFKRLKDDSTSLSKTIETIKLQNKSLQAQNIKLKQQVFSKTQELNNLISKQQDQQNHTASKKLRLQSLKKDIPTNDVQPRQSTGSIQEITKKKAQIDRLNKEVNNLIEQSHQKYLKYQEQIANLQMKEKQFNSKVNEYQSEKNELLNKIILKDHQLKTFQKVITDLKGEKQSLTLKISQVSNENKKISIQNQNKINKMESQNEASKKKMKKWKSQIQINEKAYNTKISIKDKTINDLLQQKKKLAVQIKVLAQKLEFAKVMQETKERQPIRKIEVSRFSQEDERKLRSQVNNFTDQIVSKDSEIINLTHIIKNININLSEKEKQLERSQFQLRRKQEQLQNNLKEAKQKQTRKSHINEEYKKIIQQVRQQKQEIQKKYEQQKDKKSKEISKINKQLQAKQEQVNSLLKQKNEQSIKSKDLEQKWSKSRRQNQQLLTLVHKRQNQLEQKQLTIHEQKQVIIQLKKKHSILQKELLQRQQYFKKSEVLMQELLNQNQESKAQLQRKQTEIMQLIKQRQELHFRLSEDLDAKSQNIKMVRFDLEHQMALLKEQLQATEMNLASTKEELKIKNNLVEKLKQTINTDKKQSITTKQTREEYENQLKNSRQEIEMANNKLDIMEEQLQELKVTLNDREEEMNIVKRQKNKYYKILEEKAQYIDQLEEAIKIKCNQVDQMKETQEELEQAKQQLQSNQQKYKKEIQELHEAIKQLEQKSIETINQLKKDVAIYKEEIDDYKESEQKQKRNYKIKCNQKQQLAREVEKKDVDLMNLIKKYEQLKQRMSEEMYDKSVDMKKILQNNQEKLKQYSSALQTKQKQLSQRIQQLTIQNNHQVIEIQSLSKRLEKNQTQLSELTVKYQSLLTKKQTKNTKQDNTKSLQISEKAQEQLKNRISELQNSLESVLKQYQSSKDHVSRLQQENSQLQYKVNNLANDIEQKVSILENLNFKIQSMDSNINDLQFKLKTVISENAQLKSIKTDSLKHYPSQQQTPESLRTVIQEKIKELDEKDYQIQQIRQQHKKALKAQLNQYNTNLESYRTNYYILEKQLNTYKETNIILTLKCESLQKQYKQFNQRKQHPKSYIVSQSPNHPDFGSVDFELPEKQFILKQILSQSWHHKRFEIISKVVNQIIQIPIVKEEIVHHYDEPFEICQESRYSWPSIDMRENHEKQLMRSEYLQRLQGEINQILVKKQESFGPSFTNLHSNSAIEVLNCIRYQLVEYRNNVNQQIMNDIQFIYNNQIDFCQNVEPEIQECLQMLSSQEFIYSSLENMQKKEEEWKSERDVLKLNSMRESHKYKQDLRVSQAQKEKLLKELNNVATQLKMQESQIQDLIEKKEEEMEEHEKYFMTQSEILRKELAKENSRADRSECNFLTVKKAIEKLLQILSSKEDQGDELEDAFEHIAKICDQKDSKLKKIMESYLTLYNEQQQLERGSKEKDEKNKKKKGFFAFN